MAAGKPAEGRLLLRAYHEGGQVNIEISDDGGGIDRRASPRARPSRTGLITPEQAARMSEREAASTWSSCPASPRPKRSPTSPAAASAWTWCKTNIEKIGGTVDVQSTAGQRHDA